VGDTLEREEGGGTEAGASADESSNRKQPPPVDPKIEKELKKVPLLPLFPWFISLFFFLAKFYELTRQELPCNL
jgi:hypothetical protein